MGTLIICFIVCWAAVMWLVARNEERLDQLEDRVDSIEQDREDDPPWAS